MPPAPHPLSEYKGKFCTHRRGARGRGIPFLLTFEEWLKIWIDSGHWNERGIRKGQYVMSRPGDQGPYEVGNVKIIKCEENIREGNIGNTHTLGHKQSEECCENKRVKMLGKKCALGYRWSEEQRADLSIARMGNQNALGYTHTDEARAKMRAAAARRKLEKGIV